mmetsp:Transcript_6303/g.11458  ORF Transcript_6303/g.11458 Transcript_6303/m.11458 type:complete len:248 (+) Transcript_6303:349-1092(+)
MRSMPQLPPTTFLEPSTCFSRWPRYSLKKLILTSFLLSWVMPGLEPCHSSSSSSYQSPRPGTQARASARSPMESSVSVSGGHMKSEHLNTSPQKQGLGRIFKNLSSTRSLLPNSTGAQSASSLAFLALDQLGCSEIIPLILSYTPAEVSLLLLWSSGTSSMAAAADSLPASVSCSLRRGSRRREQIIKRALRRSCSKREALAVAVSSAVRSFPSRSLPRSPRRSSVSQGSERRTVTRGGHACAMYAK